ncbi:MAG: hypothetical protein ACJ8FY_18160 [Gemmataceae bacterium]
MAYVIDNMGLLAPMLNAPRSIAVVAVAWSPWHYQSRALLQVLESSQEQWSAGRPVDFYALWPEKDAELNRWYGDLIREQYPRFELHGHGYAPFWWLIKGQVVDCLTKPYETKLAWLQDRSARAFRAT